MYLRTAFMPVAPKSVRIQSSFQYLFTLLGSTGAKAARKMLMKLTPEFADKKSIFDKKIVIFDQFCQCE